MVALVKVGLLNLLGHLAEGSCLDGFGPRYHLADSEADHQAQSWLPRWTCMVGDPRLCGILSAIELDER